MSHPTTTPFRIQIPQAALDDLRNRLAATRWPHPVPGREDRTDFSRGIPPAYVRELAEYWNHDFDWRAQEERLNELAQVTTTVQGQSFHAVHARSANPAATPLLLVHGWPGSFVEYQRLLPLLTDDFHVVIPSPPGFAFSTPLSSTGWDLARTAGAYADIMTRLGYPTFAAHATDMGTGILGELATAHPERVFAAHYAAEQRILGLVGTIFPAPTDLSDPEREVLAGKNTEAAADAGYLAMQQHRPDTIGVALTDSPVAQLAWIAEKFRARTAATPDETVNRDQLLTLVSLYWFTRSGESSAQFYYESVHSGRPPSMGAPVRTGWAVFDSHPLVRRVMDPAGAVDHWSDSTEGGHFPAMETPELLARDLRDFLR
ncbi:epoxide hydrolase family protein [Serinibacter salmoneus]|uniref:Pimeloyl-ACP methyl ester carboxylesterase n=1 Tax=Serinibacter salmoneus TaxID=556530 RepID=A0A2A9D424_9MICO|nr:epoxide hydrolase family protein [Serinibacter salmoneus]PFG21141.1 pimeloyl-ACP methyl ester carboxylesterase [Serinibacter salmoneus]